MYCKAVTELELQAQREIWTKKKKTILHFDYIRKIQNSNLPCKKYDMDFHGNSPIILCHKSTAVWSKSTPNSMTIPCHLSRLYLYSMLEHDMDFGQVQVTEFPWHLLRKWWDFPCGFRLIFDQTAVKKTWGNPCHIFYRVSLNSQNFPWLPTIRVTFSTGYVQTWDSRHTCIICLCMWAMEFLHYIWDMMMMTSCRYLAYILYVQS